MLENEADHLEPGEISRTKEKCIGKGGYCFSKQSLIQQNLTINVHVAKNQALIIKEKSSDPHIRKLNDKLDIYSDKIE